jgi:negative regulator of sigma E activity
MNDAIRMQLSAFVDGELPENEAELLLRRMSQDVELRNEVAEYLAIGRLIRDEAGLSGADRLRERIAAAVDERPADDDAAAGTDGVSRAIRPLAGMAIAATVALVAIFALQQIQVSDEIPADAPLPVANDGVPSMDAGQERQRQFLLNHAETSTDLGANGLNSRVVTLRLGGEPLLDGVLEEELDEDADASDELDESAEAPTLP